MGNKHYWVYIHINKKNGKRYVGITTKARPEMRWGKNGSGYLNGNQPKFANAIKKHGWYAFDHIAVAVESKEKMLSLEQYYIQYYDTLNPSKGYNTLTGGEHSLHTEETKTKLSELAKERFSNPENNGMYHKHHSEATRKKQSEIAKQQHRSVPQEAACRQHEENSIPIWQFSKEGIFIGEWASAAEAGKALDIPNTNITQCCKGNYLSADEFMWRYKSECTSTTIPSYDELIKNVYKTIGEKNAQKGRGRKHTPESRAKMSKSHKGKMVGADNPNYGKHLTDEEKEQKSITLSRVTILQYTLDGEFVREWRGSRQIERELGFPHANIINCCKGKCGSSHDFIWRYA